MKVKDLLAILSQQDPELDIATHALNHTAHHPYRMRVALLHTWQGPCLVIGDLSKRHVNYPNEYVTVEVDGGPVLPENWR